jgi:hypothetical protein
LPGVEIRSFLVLPECATTLGLPAHVFGTWPTAPHRNADSKAMPQIPAGETTARAFNIWIDSVNRFRTHARPFV